MVVKKVSSLFLHFTDPVTAPPVCAVPMCTNACATTYKTDANGCQTCDCAGMYIFVYLTL